MPNKRPFVVAFGVAKFVKGRRSCYSRTPHAVHLRTADRR